MKEELDGKQRLDNIKAGYPEVKIRAADRKILKAAVQGGDAEAQYIYSKTLSKFAGAFAGSAAQYWLEKAALNGFEPAVRGFADINQGFAPDISVLNRIRQENAVIKKDYPFVNYMFLIASIVIIVFMLRGVFVKSYYTAQYGFFGYIMIVAAFLGCFMFYLSLNRIIKKFRHKKFNLNPITDSVYDKEYIWSEFLNSHFNTIQERYKYEKIDRRLWSDEHSAIKRKHYDKTLLKYYGIPQDENKSKYFRVHYYNDYIAWKIRIAEILIKLIPLVCLCVMIIVIANCRG